jgi:hypothetical protein
VLLAGNVIEPVAGDASRTKLTLITHINPGGIVDNALGAALSNKVARRRSVASGGLCGGCWTIGSTVVLLFS